MANGVRWIFELRDQVTGPAGAATRALTRAEAAVNRLSGAARRVSGGGFGGMVRAGESGARRVEQAVGRVNTRIQSVGHSLGNLQNLFWNLSFAAAPAVGLGLLGKQIVDMEGQRETSLLNLSTLLKTNDQGKIKGAASWIDQFADVTPYQDSDVMSSVRQLLASKFTFAQTQGLARVTGDAASAMGNDPADAAFKWKIINRALGQIKAKGRVQGDELLQLQEAGIGTDAYLKEAFGPNYRKLQEQGKLAAGPAIMAIVRGLDRDYGGSMEKQSRTLFGMASTLLSRPQRIAGRLFDEGGLDEAKRFFSNLVDLTDFSKPPGSRALARLTVSGRKLSRALFGPLAAGTEGAAAEKLVDNLLDKLDEFSGWWEVHGPRLAREGRGFGEGLAAAGQGAQALIQPLTWLAGLADRAAGGDGSGMLGKILGFGVGAALLGRLGNFLSFGLLGKLGSKAGAALLGGLKLRAQGLLTRGVLGELLTNPRGLLAGARAAFTSLGGRAGIGALAQGGLKAVPVIGWIITGLVTVKELGDQMYARWERFATLMDGIKGKLSWVLKPADQQDTALGRALAFDVGKWIQGKPQAWEEANKGFLGGVEGTARRLGINPADLLKVMNFESSLDPSARNSKSGASGLIQFLPDTARELGTTTEALRRMTREQQLPYVERYLQSHGVKPGASLEQLYMSVLAGNAGRSGSLWLTGTPEYAQNAGLDTNKDGIITTREATQMVEQRWAKDAPQLTQTLNINFSGPPDAAAVSAIQQAARSGALGAFGQLAGEGGWSPGGQ